MRNSRLESATFGVGQIDEAGQRGRVPVWVHVLARRDEVFEGRQSIVDSSLIGFGSLV